MSLGLCAANKLRINIFGSISYANYDFRNLSCKLRRLAGIARLELVHNDAGMMDSVAVRLPLTLNPASSPKPSPNLAMMPTRRLNIPRVAGLLVLSSFVL